MEIVYCPNCDKVIPEKRAQLGYKTCVDCSTAKKYIGRRMDKHGDIEIYRENIAYFQAHIKRENRLGFSPTVPVSSPGVEQSKIDQTWRDEGLTPDKKERKAKDFIV